MTTLPHTITGPAEAPAVLLLHGFIGAADDWHAVAADLSDAFRCIAVDLPGHGEAVDLPDEAYTAEGTTATLMATLDALGVERCHVVGYSMGGRLALYLALRHPERCARLVLESASPGLRREAERAERRALDEDRAVAIERDFLRFLDTWYRMPLFASLKDHPDVRAAIIERRRRNRPDEIARSLRGFGTGQQPSLWEDLPRLAIPTLAVAGSRDRKYADLAFEMAVAGPPVMPLVVRTGHTVHAEQPALFAALVRDFIRDPVPHPQPALT
ncbi:MAG: 2-succinyl-6-hydroxy-2,4-cyclohexadiene-1-carboxylate synthase [Rhodothermales bacterium]